MNDMYADMNRRQKRFHSVPNEIIKMTFSDPIVFACLERWVTDTTDIFVLYHTIMIQMTEERKQLHAQLARQGGRNI